MKKKYLLRLDDACPTMDHLKWQRLFDILDLYGVRPMVGLIPHNEDPNQEIEVADSEFWNKARQWEQKGYAIALHGYNHCYSSNEAGINPIWNRSEFAGISYEDQCKKISAGYAVLKENGLNPKYFFAPSHTFDENTLKALRICTPIRIICDTIATRPYLKGDFVYIPQLGGHCMEIPFSGVWTFCLHPTTMKDADFEVTENFLKAHKDEFIGFDELNLINLKEKSLFSKLLSWAYFAQRKIRK